jgi:transcriptional regulator with XRE-family HTH domain
MEPERRPAYTFFVNIPYMEAATTLRDARRRAGLTQRALASRSGIPQPAIARIERGTVVPRVDTLDRLLAGCGEQLGTERRPGLGIDRTAIRALLRLTPAQRLRLATREGRNLERLEQAAAS